MLQITHSAASFLSEIRRGQDVPETYGLRVFPESTEPGEITIGLGFTDALAMPLDDAAIDVAAEDGATRLIFRPQGELQN